VPPKYQRLQFVHVYKSGLKSMIAWQLGCGVDSRRTVARPAKVLLDMTAISLSASTVVSRQPHHGRGRLPCVSPRTAAVLGSTITACVAMLERETDVDGVVDAAAAAAAQVSFVDRSVEGRSMVGQWSVS
jgi:hypothetical protein